MKKILVLMLTLISSPSWTSPVTFDLRDPSIESLDEVSTFSLNQFDLVLTLSTNSGVLNQTSSSFGINARATGDNTSQIDKDENLYLSFNQRVRIDSIFFSRLSGADTGLIQFTGFTAELKDSNEIHFDRSYFLDSGEQLYITSLAGSFSFDQVTVEVAAVPEPNACVLLLFSLVLLRHIRRRLNRVRQIAVT